MRRLLRHAVLFACYGGLAVGLAGAALYRKHLEGLPGLMPWHTARLDAEFRAEDASRVATLEGYRALEERLLGQLAEEVYDRVPAESRSRASRFTAGSLADPPRRPVDWNRTVELSAPDPRAGVLLLHGLSDSPYTLRALGEELHARGYQVVALRLPGHGTAPAGLVRVRWEDMAAAVRLAARDLRRRVPPDRPLFVVGYSMGAALAVEYCLARLQGESLPAVDRLVLVSPAIGVSPAAALAVWQGRLSLWLGLRKVAWTDVVPEYDPYKYNSFPVNGADQVYRLTSRIAGRIADLRAGGPIAGMPRLLAFQSVVDATVTAPALLETLLQPLAAEGHEAVVFDVNRHADILKLLRPGAIEDPGQLLTGPPRPFGLTVLTNASRDTLALDAVHRAALSREVTRESTGLAWPEQVFSLSHVALPFPPDDPVYGATRPEGSRTIFLGRPELMGERGLLAVSPTVLLRLRHDPFYAYLAGRALAFLDAP